MEGEMFPEPDTTATSSSSRGEKRTETQENVFATRRLMTKSPKRPIALHPPPEEPVKRRLMKKTDLKNDESAMKVDEDLLNVVNTLMRDETVPETNPDEDHELPKLTVLDDHEEMMKGWQKELMKRSEAAGKREIQTRRVDREKDGRMKSKVVLKDYNRCQERTQPEMFSPTPSTLSLERCWLRAHTTETTIQNQTTSQLQLTYTQHSCTRMSTKICLQNNHQNQMSGMIQD